MPQFWSSRRLVLVLERAMPRVSAISSAGRGFSERKRRACTWATVRLMPQRVPISPQCRMNFCATGERFAISISLFCLNRNKRNATPVKRPSVFQATRPRLYALIGRLSRRSYYWSGIVALFAWAAWQRFSLPLDPITDPDMWGYLSPALRKLIGAEFGHTEGRNFLYPGFLFVLLRVFGDLRAITVAQHILGLLAGAMLLIIWRRARVFAPDPRVGRPAYDGLGLLAAAVFLLATEPTRFETQLRPEGICAFLIGLNFYFVLEFTARCFVERRSRGVVGYGIGAVASSIL